MQKPNISRLLSTAVPPFLAASIALLAEQAGIGTRVTAVLVVLLTVILWRLLSWFERPQPITGASADASAPLHAKDPGHAIAESEENRSRAFAIR
jgi:hypothetical protein